jgi:hypothetical protein
MGDHQRLKPRLGLSRLDAGRAFFGMFYVFILIGWYPQLQTTYVNAYRGTDLALTGLVAVAAGAAWGSGGLMDGLLVAAAAALGSATGFALGGALVAELSAVRPFYASPLDSSTLETALSTEFLAAVAGPALGALAGAAWATFAAPRAARPTARWAALGLLGVAVCAIATATLGVASIELVVSRTSANGPAASIDPLAVRVAALVLSCLAAASAVLIHSDEDGKLGVAITVPRLLAGTGLVAIPFLVVEVYRSLVLNPF